MASLIVKTIYWLKPDTTNIDRRKCSRTVPMEVLVLGCSRTATTSITAGLKQLGYYDVYHASNVYEKNPRDADMWVAAYRAKFHGEGKPFGKAEWDQLLGHCMAVTDVPAIHFCEELIDAYPNAKVVLSMRDSPEAWLKSVQSTLIPIAQRAGATTTLQRIRKLFLPRLPFQAMNEEMSQIDENSSVEQFAKITTDFYLRHNEKVRMLVAERDERLRAAGRSSQATGLLEFNVKQGWRPLCEYLGKPIPRDQNGEELAFPRLNDTTEFNSKTGILANIMDFLAVFNMLMTGVSVWAAYRAASWALETYR